MNTPQKKRARCCNCHRARFVQDCFGHESSWLRRFPRRPIAILISRQLASQVSRLPIASSKWRTYVLKPTCPGTSFERSRPAGPLRVRRSEQCCLMVGISFGSQGGPCDPFERNDGGGRSAYCPFCPSPIGTPEIVPVIVISPVSVPKTTFFKRSNNTGVAVSAYVRTPEAS